MKKHFCFSVFLGYVKRLGLGQLEGVKNKRVQSERIGLRVWRVRASERMSKCEHEQVSD